MHALQCPNSNSCMQQRKPSQRNTFGTKKSSRTSSSAYVRPCKCASKKCTGRTALKKVRRSHLCPSTTAHTAPLSDVAASELVATRK